jgi:hypothetical protein
MTGIIITVKPTATPAKKGFANHHNNNDNHDNMFPVQRSKTHCQIWIPRSGRYNLTRATHPLTIVSCPRSKTLLVTMYVYIALRQEKTQLAIDLEVNVVSFFDVPERNRVSITKALKSQRYKPSAFTRFHCGVHGRILNR